MNRRNVLLGIAAIGASGAALHRIYSTLPDDSRTDFSDETLRIGSIDVINDHDEPHELALDVRYDGDLIRSERFDLGTSRDTQGVSIDDLPADAGTYELTASLPDGQTSELVPEYYADEERADWVLVMVDSEGHLSPFFTKPCQQQS